MHCLIPVAVVINFVQNGLVAAENALSVTRTSRYPHDASSPIFYSGDHFWNISSRHFSTARVVFVIMLSSSEIQLETERMAPLLVGMHHILNTPIILCEEIVGTFGNNVTSKMFSSAGRYETSYAFVIVTEDVNHILKYLETSQRLWRPDVSLLILLIQTNDCSDKTVSTVEYSHVFKYLWEGHQTCNVILFVKSMSKCDDETFFYNPYTEINGNSERGQVYKDMDERGIHEFFQSMSSNLHGYLLRVSMFPYVVTAIEIVKNDTEGSSYKYRGRDGLILDVLAKYMNFTPYVMLPSDNIFSSIEFANGTVTGPLKDIADGEADIAMNSVFLKVSYVAHIDHITPVIHFGKMCVLVPKALRVPVWVSLFRCFSIVLWAVLIVTYILSAIFLHALRTFSFSHQSHEHMRWSTSLSHILNIFLSIPFIKIFTFTVQSQRMFVTSCMLFSIVVTCVFQGSLFNKLKNPVYSKDIDTLEELDESGLPIFALDEDLHDVFDLIDTPTAKRLSKRFTVYEGSDDKVNQTAYHRNSSVLLSLIFIEMSFKTYPMLPHLVHRVEECPMTYFSSYMVPKGSPYLKRINTLFARMFEAGLSYKWYNDAIYEKYLPLHLRFANSYFQDPRQSPFSFTDLLIAFIFLIFGFSLSGAVLFIEYYLNKHQHLMKLFR